MGDENENKTAVLWEQKKLAPFYFTVTLFQPLFQFHGFSCFL
jgi:hypothetical protein